jgi:hypothetical protein
MDHGLTSQQMWELAKDRQNDMLRKAQQVALIKQSWPVEAQPQTNRQSTFDSTFFWPIKIFLRQLFAMRSSSVSG